MIDRLYIELLYRHSIVEMLFWSILTTAFWYCISLPISRKNKKTWIWMNNGLLFFIVFFILWNTVFSRSNSNQEASLLPFASFIEAQTQPERYRTVVANILLFVPFGLSMPFVLDNRSKLGSLRRNPVVCTILAATAFSFFIELTQYVLSLGLCETDDVIFNTVGAMIGSLAFVVARRTHGKKVGCQ